MIDFAFIKPFLMHGWLHFSALKLTVVTLVLTHITIVSVTIFLHRSQAHRSLDLHPIASHFFRFWLWMTTGMVTKEWVAIHRKHHAHVESEGDPHSPAQYGINRVLWGGVFLYSQAASDQEILQKYGHGTPDDWVERTVYAPHSALGILLMLLLNCVLWGLPGLLVWVVQMAWIPFWAAGVINGLGHYWGYRNYEPEDRSTNLVPWGILIGGEELHNNHHACSTSAKLSAKPWEFDIGWMYIRMLASVGLATVKRTMPSLDQLEALVQSSTSSANQNELERMKALVRNRLQIIEQYVQTVMHPTYAEEKKRLKYLGSHQEWRALKGIRRLMMRNRAQLCSQKRTQLDQTLALRERLNTVYDFRNRLHAICHDRKGRADVQSALLSWCQQASQTEILALQGFAQWLGQYLPHPVAAS